MALQSFGDEAGAKVGDEDARCVEHELLAGVVYHSS